MVGRWTVSPFPFFLLPCVWNMLNASFPQFYLHWDIHRAPLPTFLPHLLTVLHLRRPVSLLLVLDASCVVRARVSTQAVLCLHTQGTFFLWWWFMPAASSPLLSPTAFSGTDLSFHWSSCLVVWAWEWGCQDSVISAAFIYSFIFTNRLWEVGT